MITEDMLLKDGWCGVYIYPSDDDELDRKAKTEMENIGMYEEEDEEYFKEEYIEENSHYLIIPKKDVKHISDLIDYVNSDNLNMDHQVYGYDELEFNKDLNEMFMYDDYWEPVEGDLMKKILCLL